MRQLSKPISNSKRTLDTCISGVSDAVAKAQYEADRGCLEKGIDNFETASTAFNWCKLPRVPNGKKNQIVVGSLTKEHLINLYSNHMVGSKGEARKIYDEILVAANGKCPFCAGIGHAKTLDHYLPKANFPLYSIVSTNLVPCCRDCNTEKLAAFPNNTEEQTIHPYLDSPHFFLEKWTFATVNNTDPLSVQFEARPPATWLAADQNRVKCHFKEYCLAKRYNIEAATGISEIVHVRKTTLKGYSADLFRIHLFEMAQDPSTPINGWRRTLYYALASADWFSKIKF